MKKLFLGTVLILISLTGKLFAQESLESPQTRFNRLSKTDQTFNGNKSFAYVRDFVQLREGKMILELFTMDDYDVFRNVDSLLREVKKDVSFYKDSLDANPTANVRIDYALTPGYNYKKIRFKIYPSDGNIFLNKEGAISKLKFEQDTLRIIIQRSRPGIGGNCMIPYSIQMTLLLDNYYDIEKVIASNNLKAILDTLKEASKGKMYKGTMIYNNPFSIVYNPYYFGKDALKRYEWLMKDEDDKKVSLRHKKGKFISLNASVGIGYIRDRMVTMGDIGLQYNNYWGINHKDHNLFRLSATPYFFWEHNPDGTYLLKDNWWVNGAIGSIYDKLLYGWYGKECTFGLGYLVGEKGGYFKNTTMKVFTDLQLNSWVTIVPEIIFTDNFKQIFPGFTLKVF